MRDRYEAALFYVVGAAVALCAIMAYLILRAFVDGAIAVLSAAYGAVLADPLLLVEAAVALVSGTVALAAIGYVAAGAFSALMAHWTGGD